MASDDSYPNNMREMRRQSGKTLRGASREAGIHYTTLRRAERGMHRLSRESAERLARVYGVTYEELFLPPSMLR